MEATYAEFDHEESACRIRDILAIPDSAYIEKDSIPAREELTFDNGFYVNACAVFVDIRGSKKLADQLKLPALARVNRLFISEMVAVLRDHMNVREMFIEGDCVWAVYDTPMKHDIDGAFSRCYSAVSLVDIFNHYLARSGISPLRIGVGIDYGRALMIKAGHKGSGVNEIVWTGRLVGKAAQLCSFGNRTYADHPIMVSGVVQQNLNDNNKKLLSWNQNRECWHGHVVQTGMNNWLLTERAAGR
jgi:class 3 adenylate cyclase